MKTKTFNSIIANIKETAAHQQELMDQLDVILNGIPEGEVPGKEIIAQMDDITNAFEKADKDHEKFITKEQGMKSKVEIEIEYGGEDFNEAQIEASFTHLEKGELTKKQQEELLEEVKALGVQEHRHHHAIMRLVKIATSKLTKDLKKRIEEESENINKFQKRLRGLDILMVLMTASIITYCGLLIYGLITGKF